MKTILISVGLFLATAVGAITVPVTFRVDMSGAPGFNSTLDTIEVRGDFNGWSGGSVLVPSANTNICTNTFNVTADTNALGFYKFTWNGNYELQGMGNRPFTQANGAQTLPLVYFSDAPPLVSATTNSITFRVSLSAQVTLGSFDPLNDTVSVAGSFQSPNQWEPRVFQLTNSGVNNLYMGTTNDGNYPGTYEEYKFIITRGGNNDVWESINNRSFMLTNHEVLPVVFFNDIGNALPVKFQVDLSKQAAVGRFDSGVDVVECKGSFNGWSGGFVLTNDLSAANPNLYSGACFIFDNPGSVEYHRFTVNGGYSRLGWETPASFGSRDRSFVLASGGQTLPAVLWSDLTLADLLTGSSTVTFKVNMTDAVGTDGHVFDPQADAVYLNGDWIPWWSWDGSSGSAYQVTNNPPGSGIYSLTLALPAGYAIPLSYKYSINGFDNEAGFGTNHIRYVRAPGSYALPMDTFGNQFTEAAVGSLKIQYPAVNDVLVTWLGRPGVHLQTATNLASGAFWQDRLDTEGLSSKHYATSPGGMFFRLVKP